MSVLILVHLLQLANHPLTVSVLAEKQRCRLPRDRIVLQSAVQTKQAEMTGILQGEKGSPQQPAGIGTSLVDLYAGMTAHQTGHRKADLFTVCLLPLHR